MTDGATADTPAKPRASALPETSLIICSRNRPQLLAESVDSIFAGAELPTELIIVDQSDARHAKLAALTSDRCRLRYLHTRSVGLSRANNAGIRAARADLLVFTHDDVLVTPGWFGTLVRALVAAGPRAVVTGQVRAGAADQPEHFAPSTIENTEPAVYEGRVAADPIFPLNMAFFRGAVEEVGGFDVRLGPGTAYPGAEDNDLGFRLLEAGFRILYEPEAILYHRAWRPKADYLSLQWSYGRGQGAFFAKHFSLRDRFMLGRFANTVLKHIPAHRSRRRRAIPDAVYLLGLLSGATSWTLTEWGKAGTAERLDP